MNQQNIETLFPPNNGIIYIISISLLFGVLWVTKYLNLLIICYQKKKNEPLHSIENTLNGITRNTKTILPHK